MSGEYPIISKADLTLGALIGRGARGTVYEATWKGQRVAVKQVLDNVELEAGMLSKLSHKNIIGFYGASQHPESHLVIEIATHGSLHSYLRNYPLQFERIIDWSLQIAEACEYLHFKAPDKVIHRDLKSMNVLICDNYVVKLCDFGSSHEYIRATLMSFAGTASWMAPEVIRNEIVSDRADVFSFGVVLWEMLTQQMPFEGMSPMAVMWLVASQRKRLPIPSRCPKQFATLIESCWMEKPNERPSMSEILAILRSLKKFTELPKETQTFLGSRNIWKTEIEEVMDILKKSESEILRREAAVKRKEEELSRRERELQALQSTLETMRVTREMQQRNNSGSSALSSWSEDEVASWVSSLNFPQYAPLFVRNNINGELLSSLTENELEKIGITSLGHQKAIIAAISRLMYTLNFPILQPTIQLTDRTLSTSSSPSNTLPSSASSPSLRSPSSNVTPPMSRSASAVSDGSQRHVSLNIVIFHRRVQSINATYRVGIWIEVDPVEPFHLPDTRSNSSSSMDSEGSGGGQTSQSKGFPPNLDGRITSDFVERAVFHWPGESDFGQLVTLPPFEGKTTREIRPGSEIIVEVHFNKNKYRKKIFSARHKISLTDGYSRHPITLRPKASAKN